MNNFIFLFVIRSVVTGSVDSKLFEFTKPPVLMIGSGLSKRYLTGYKSWEDLLRSVSERMGFSKRRFLSYLTDANDNHGRYGALPRLASNLKEVLMNGLKDGSFEAEKIFDRDGELDFYDRGIDPFKILVASEVRTYEIIDSDMIKEELSNLRNLINTVPSVITTNYDCFLENEIFREFAVYSKMSDYYFSDSQGIGEIFKIHGTCEDPNSLVVCEKDYELFDENSKIISAKMLSMLCDYPMLILGYSLDDSDVKDVINDLMGSLDEEKLKIVEKNVIYVSYKTGVMDPVKTHINFEYGNKRMTLSAIETDNFNSIYKEISGYLPSTSSLGIRKIRQLVKNIVLTAEPSPDQYLRLGVKNMDTANNENIMLIISDKEYGKVVKDTVIITIDVIIDDILNKGMMLEPATVLRFFNEYPYFSSNMYVPLYPYMRKLNLEENKYSKKIKKFLTSKEMQFDKYLIRIERYCSGYDCNPTDPFRNIKNYNKPLMIVYMFEKGMIDYEAAMNLLRSIFEIYKTGNANFDTNFKFAVTYLTSKS